ncbi:MAG: ATP synthase F0 subunit B [Bryobacteraceae bacterium]
MEATLHQLGGILLSALPTFILVIFLHYYLKFMFFKPLEKVLGERHAATEGARALAVESLQRAERKTAEYEAAMRAERAKIYREFEQHHKRLQEEENAALLAERTAAEQHVREAREELARELEAAKTSLAATSDALAGQIAESILRRRAA